MLWTQKPYSWEIPFYEKHNIPLWSGPMHTDIDLWLIYSDESWSTVHWKVNCLPAQFFTFEIYNAENKRSNIMSTWSGSLSDYYDTAVLIAQWMISIK